MNGPRIGLFAAAVGSLSLMACQSTDLTSGQTLGTVLGGVAGGLVGSQIGDGSGQVIATVAGTLIGGLIGNQIGRYLDERDQQLNQQAALQSFESGEQNSWSNPETGNSGVVTTVQPAVAQSGGVVCSIQESEVVLADGTTETTQYRLCNRNGQYYTEPV